MSIVYEPHGYVFFLITAIPTDGEQQILMFTRIHYSLSIVLRFHKNPYKVSHSSPHATGACGILLKLEILP